MHETSPASAVPSPRSRFRVAASRIGVMAQVVAAAAGAVGFYDARAEGRAVSRPAAIAFWAGGIGLALSLVVPRARAYVRARRSVARG